MDLTLLELPFGALFLLFMPPALFATLGALIVVVHERKQRQQFWKPQYSGVASHLLFFFGAMVVQVWRARPGVAPLRDYAAEVWLAILLFGSLASCIYWVRRMREMQLFAIGLMALLELPLLSALYMVGMSIMGGRF